MHTSHSRDGWVRTTPFPIGAQANLRVAPSSSQMLRDDVTIAVPIPKKGMILVCVCVRERAIENNGINILPYRNIRTMNFSLNCNQWNRKRRIMMNNPPTNLFVISVVWSLLLHSIHSFSSLSNRIVIRDRNASMFLHRYDTASFISYGSTRTKRYIFPPTFARGYSANMDYRRNVILPILDVSEDRQMSDFGMNASPNDDEDDNDKIMTPSNTLTPLPSAHLPVELSSLNIYGIELKSPSHIRMMQEAERNGSYGHIVTRSAVEGGESGLIGAIGCAVDVISCVFERNSSNSNGDNDDDSLSSVTGVTALVRGSFRFVVREVVSTFPYPVLIVDELLDDSPYGNEDHRDDTEKQAGDDIVDDEDDDDDDDDDYYGYDSIPCDDLPARCMSAMEALVRMKLDVPDTSPLEDMILESKGLTVSSQAKSISEEMAAVFDVFRMELVEISDRVRRCFAIGMMAVEIAELDFEQRKDALVTTNGCYRLRTVLQIMESKISMARAKKMAEQLTSTNDDEKELQVGKPSMPPWVKSIQAGTRLEYFWSENDGWCSGTVIERLDIADEILLSIKFDDDGSTHRIPFTAEEKVRWRPL